MALVILAVLAAGFQEPAAFDFSKVERRLASEPRYVAEPRYALILLGPDTRFPMWIALDKSDPALEHYDVLYLDRDADGRLGEEGERFEIAERWREYWAFFPGIVEVPGCDLKIDKFRIRYYWSDKNPFVWFSLRVNGKVTLSGGAKRDLRFADSAEECPVFRADPFGPLSFRLESPDHLKSGGHFTIILNIGIPGSEPSAFTTVDDRFLEPDKDRLFATLIAKNAQDEEVRARFQLKRHC